MKNFARFIVIALVILGALLVKEWFYVVDETEQVVITMFGKPVGKPVTEPGLKFKLPFVHKITKYPKNILEWDGPPGQVPTKDKTFISVDVFGRWRIFDALTFRKKIKDINSAQDILDGIVDAAVRNYITSYNLIEAVRSSDRVLSETVEVGVDSGITPMNIAEGLEIGRAKMQDSIKTQAQAKLEEFGINLVEVRFKRINYVEQVLQKVYDRMIQERRQIAEKHRSEGRGESQKIIGQKEKKLNEIYSEAYRKSETVKGEADGLATRIYASAYNRDPEFYSFMKTLDLYKESLDSTTGAVLSTEADFLKYFKKYSK